MQDNNLKFCDGEVYFKNNKILLLPLNTFIIMFNKILENEKEPRALIKNATLIDTILISKQINLKNKINAIKTFLNEINSLGIGEVELVKISKDKIYLVQRKKHLSQIYEKIYSKKPKVLLEEIFLNYILNFIEILTLKNANGKIIEKNNQLYYEINFNEESNLKIIESELEYENSNKEITNPLLKKIISNTQILIKDGKNSLWNTYTIFLPYYFILSLVHSLEEEYDEFFSSLGSIQAKAAVSLQTKIFGIKEKEKLLTSLIEQLNLIGVGKCTKVEIIKNKYEIYFENTHEHYKKKLKINQRDEIEFYIIGILKGIVEFVYKISTKVKIENNKYTFTEIKDSRELTKIEKEIEKFYNISTLVVKTK